MANHPYTQPSGEFNAPNPTKSDSGVKILLIILIVVGLLGVLTCAGLGVGAYFALKKAQETIRDVAINALDDADTEIVKEIVQDAPELKESVGDVSEIAYDKEKMTKDFDLSTFTEWYRVKGSKGEVTIKVVPSDEARWYDSASIVKEDGTEVPLTLPALPHYDYETRDAYKTLSREPKIMALLGKITSVDYPTTEDEEKNQVNDSQVMYRVKGENDSGLVILTYGSGIERPVSADLKLDKAGSVQVSLSENAP